MTKIVMLASVAGAIATWGIFSVVTIDLATKKGNAETVKKINEEEVPRMNWYWVDEEKFKVGNPYIPEKGGHLSKKEMITKATKFINNQTIRYCPFVKIVDFKKYKQLPIFNKDGGVIWEPFVYLVDGEGGDLKPLKHPEWYCVTKTIWDEDYFDYVEASYTLYNHPFST